MNQELIIHHEQHVILMKNGVAHFVSKETWDRINDRLATQSAHGFIRITELGGIVINSAEVEITYTPDQYHEYINSQQGLVKCMYGNWHKKRQTCDCKDEFYRKERERRDKEWRDQEYAPLTDEQRKANQKTIEKIGKELREKGILRSKRKAGKV